MPLKDCMQAATKLSEQDTDLVLSNYEAYQETMSPDVAARAAAEDALEAAKEERRGYIEIIREQHPGLLEKPKTEPEPDPDPSEFFDIDSRVPVPKKAGYSIEYDDKGHPMVRIDPNIIDETASNYGYPEFTGGLDPADPLLQPTQDKHTTEEPHPELTASGGRKYTPERTKLHEKVIKKIMSKGKKPEGRKPRVILSGGGMAAGKGTMLGSLIKDELIDPENHVHIDPDEVKESIPEYLEIIESGDLNAGTVAHFESSDISDMIKNRSMEAGYDLIIDRSLRDKQGTLKEIQEFKDAGYDVHLVGVVADVNIALTRSLGRYYTTGRLPPPALLVGSNIAFNRNFESYLGVVDTGIILDATADPIDNIVASSKKGVMEIHNKRLYNKAQRRGKLNEKSEDQTLRSVTVKERTERQNDRLSQEGEARARSGVRKEGRRIVREQRQEEVTPSPDEQALASAGVSTATGIRPPTQESPQQSEINRRHEAVTKDLSQLMQKGGPYPSLRKVRYKVFRTQAEMLTHLGMDPASVSGVISGAYNEKTHEVLFVSENINGPIELQTTLRHEVFGHYGMRDLLNKDGEFDAVLARVFNSKDGELKAEYEWVMSNYPELFMQNEATGQPILDANGNMIPVHRRKIADEMMARAAEIRKPGNIMDWVYDRIAALMRAAGFVSDNNPISRRELNSLLRASAKQFRKRTPRGTIELDGLTMQGDGMRPSKGVPDKRVYFSRGQMPMDKESRLARAREQGFDTDTVWYRAQGAEHIDGSLEGRYFTSIPDYANDYAKDVVDIYNETPSIVPVYANTSNFKIEDDINNVTDYAWERRQEELIKQGYTGVMDSKKTVMVPFNQSKIRSIHAAFDPSQNDSDNILFKKKEKLGQNEITGNLALAAPELVEAVEENLNRRAPEEKARILDNLERLKGTSWAAVTVKGIALREYMIRLREGRDVTVLANSEAWGGDGPRMANGQIMQAFKIAKETGDRSLLALIQGYNFVGNNPKAENDLSTSYSNCGPSLACATHCYATNGLGGMPNHILKAEFTDLILELYPQETTNKIIQMYESTAASQAGLALRINDKGDLSEGQVKMIQALNGKGIATQVFSKRPELLRQLSDINLKMLSIDDTNIHVAEENPDLRLAVVITDGMTEEMLAKINDRVSVYLPVNLKGQHWSPAVIKERFPSISQDMLLQKMCPVEIGKKRTAHGTKLVQIQSGLAEKGLWTCTACDLYGAAGCFKGDRQTKKRMLDSHLSGEYAAIRGATAVSKITPELKLLKELGAITDEQYATISQALAQGESNLREAPGPENYDGPSQKAGGAFSSDSNRRDRVESNDKGISVEPAVFFSKQVEKTKTEASQELSAYEQLDPDQQSVYLDLVQRAADARSEASYRLGRSNLVTGPQADALVDAANHLASQGAQLEAEAAAYLEAPVPPPSEAFFRREVDEAPVGEGLGMPEETLVQKFVRYFQNSFNRVGQLQQEIVKQGGTVAYESDVYLAEELSSGKVAHRLDQLKKTMQDPMLEILSDGGVSLAELDEYLVARHSQERNAYIASINPDMPDGGSGMTNQDAQDILDGISEDPDRQATMEAAADIVYQVNQQHLDNMVIAGHMAEDEASMLRDRWEFYVPLKGKEGETTRNPMGRGLGVLGTGLKRALGRGAGNTAESPTAHSFAQTEAGIVRGEKTRVGQALLELIRNNPDPAFWNISERMYTRMEDEFGEAFYGYDTPPEGMAEKIDYHRVMRSNGQVGYMLDPNYKNRPDVFGVMHNGKEFLIKIEDPIIMEQLKKMNMTQLSTLAAGAGHINRYLAMVNTALNPEFVITNFERDFQTAMVNLGGEHSAGIAKTVAKDIPKAIRGILQDTFNTSGQSEYRDIYREMKEEGGAVGFFGLEDIDARVKKIQSAMDQQKGPLGASMRGLRGIRDTILDANLSIENAARAASYKVMRDALIRNGMPANEAKAKAASVSKNLTVNFNRKGELAPVLNSAYLFFNASIQGSARVIKALGNPRVQKIAGGIAMAAFGLALYNRAAGGDDDDGIPYWDKISDWKKQTSLIIMHPDGSGNYSSVRLPYGYNVFHYMGTNIHDFAFNEKYGLSEAAINMATAALNAYNPIQGANLLDTLLPTVVKPVAQDQFNYNFMGGPIKPDYPFDDYDRPESQKAWKSTNPVLKDSMAAINEWTGGDQTHAGWIDISPETVKHYVGWLTGGAGMTVYRTLDTATNLAKGEEIDQRNVPFLRTLGGQPGPHYDRERFYEAMKDIAAVEAGLKLRKGTDEWGEYRSENIALHNMNLYVRPAKNAIKRLREEQDAAQAAGDYDLASEKKEAIRQRMMEFTMLYDEAVAD